MTRRASTGPAAGAVAALLAVLAAAAALALAVAAPAALAAPPRISAPSAIVVDAQSGDVTYAKKPDERRPIASATKLMTALLALEEGKLSEMVPAARYRPSPAESQIRLQPGERLTEADMLRGLLIASANDAAVALANHVAGSVPTFVRRMNRRAQQLGLEDTSYANPIGLDAPGGYSTARDLATLTRELRRHRFFRRTVNRETVTLRSGDQERRLENRNTLLFQAPWADGVKTGFTRGAGDVLVASGSKRGVRLVSVVLGAPGKAERNADSLALLNYGFTKYERVRAVVRDEVHARVPIRHRAGAVLPLAAVRTVHKVKRPTEDFEFRLVGVPETVEGPITYGKRMGRLEVRLRDRKVASVPLYATLEVPAAGVARRTQDFLTTPWTLVVLGVALLALALVASRRSPAPDDRPRTRRAAPPPPPEEAGTA